MNLKGADKMIMKSNQLNTLRNCSLALALLLAGSAQAQNAVHYDAQPGGSKVKIEGTSSIHDWTVESAAVGGFMELDSAFNADLKTLTTPPKVEVNIPVRQLKSGTKAMDNVMWEHMNLTAYPTIKYRLLSFTAKAGAPSQFDAQGQLSISGVTRTNNMAVTLERIDANKIKVKGSTPVKMSDYGIKPPGLILGIKTGDEVKLSFEWTTAKAEKTAEAK